MIWELAATESRVQGLLQSYVLGALVCSLITIRNFLIGRTAAQLAADTGRNVWEESRYSISGINANDLGLMIALSIPILVYLLALRKGWLVKTLCWVQLVAGFTAILLTASRGSLLAAVVGLGMLPLTMTRLPRWQKFGSLAACAGLLACAAYLVPASSWKRITELGSQLSEGTLTNRTTIWAAGLDAFRDHAFLGVGSGAYGVTIVKTANYSYITGSAAAAVAHNTFISVLVELGVVGALLGFAFLAASLYCVLRLKKLERRLWIMLLLTWTVGVAALTWEYRKPTWLVFGLLAAHVYAQRNARTRPVIERVSRVQPISEITRAPWRRSERPISSYPERAAGREMLVAAGGAMPPAAGAPARRPHVKERGDA
jgi:hypothetical protein